MEEKESKEMKEYFEKILKDVRKLESIANKARKKGFDPEETTEIMIAENMAERVAGLISVVAPQIINSDVAKRITQLEKKYGVLDWRVALEIAKEISQNKICKFETEKEAIEIGIRTGFAYITLGVVSAPLEGFTELNLMDRNDGKGKYFKLKYSGPVRNAGGTAAAVSVLIADYVRICKGFAKYDPTEEEIKRTFIELQDYHDRVTNLQYFPSEEEVDFLMRHLPIQIGGEPTEKFDVSNYKGLRRISTDKIRSGFCLIHSSCIPLKAPKLWKQIQSWGNEFEPVKKEWEFLKDFIEIRKKTKTAEKKEEENSEEKPKIMPIETFLKDTVAGRPTFGEPMKGFRLRYGRSRTSGFSAQSLHPATMIVLENTVAIGTQLKVERPGKAASITSCDSIEGPVVELETGEVIKIDSEEKAKEVSKKIKRILFLGDLLINYGDFLDRAHILVPPGYCEEWWVQELEKAIVDSYGNLDYEKFSEETELEADEIKELIENFFEKKPNFSNAFVMSLKSGVPLHPAHLFFWNEISKDDLKYLAEKTSVSQVVKSEDGKKIIKIIMQNDEKTKFLLEKLCAPHKIQLNESIIIEKDCANALFYPLGFFKKNISEILKEIDSCESEKPSDILSKISGIKIKDKLGLKIGARMGRPEKAKMRKLKGGPHVLFPVGEEGGKLRSFQAALEKREVNAEFPIYYCSKCKEHTIYKTCPFCDEKTKPQFFNMRKNEFSDKKEEGFSETKIFKLNIKKYFEAAKKSLGLKIHPDMIKGVKGTINHSHIPERLEKGFLRAMNRLNVNKEGTVRCDASELPITHFKPKEIGTTLEKLKVLGYEKDIHGKLLENENQILELKPQDILLPAFPAPAEESIATIFLRVANFIDQELEKLYGLPKFYKMKTDEDLVGHLVIGLAPHTSAGIVCRIIGFTNTQGFFAHPYLHAAMRRDCDGDESAIILLLDAFINFSKKYISSKRGATMDCPLVLTPKLLPAEVDDMVFNMDIARKYPLSFYRGCEEYRLPWKIDDEIKTIKNTLDSVEQYEKMMFTHPTDDINKGVKCSAYKTLPSMKEKLDIQMKLAEKIVDVNQKKVASAVIEKHFMKDLKGNLRKFSQQQFRCSNCNEKYRRPPLIGRCIKCGGNLIFTVTKGSIIKYLEPMMGLMNKYDVSTYIKQSVELLERRIEDVFGREKEKQEGLKKFF